MGSVRELNSLLGFGLCCLVFACTKDDDDYSCPVPCPGAMQQLAIMAWSSSGEGSVRDLEATFSGPVTGELSCEARPGDSICFWSPGGAVAGAYTLTFTAPGYRTKSVSAVVTSHSDARCGCDSPWLTLDLTLVMLDPL